jgi:8-oxo-dGTP diphosphatase
MENNPIYGCERVGQSVIMRGRSDRDWVYLSCKDLNELNLVKDRLTEKDTCFGAIEEWMIPTLVKGKKVLWKLEFEQYYLPDEIILPNRKQRAVNLQEKDAETIYENSDYKDYISTEYVKQRINQGFSKGIFENSELIGWGLTQDDGALGFLHVMDKARKKGVGMSIVSALVEEMRKEGKIPFGYIEHDNKNSLNLVKKLGFVRQKDCAWFEIEN